MSFFPEIEEEVGFSLDSIPGLPAPSFVSFCCNPFPPFSSSTARIARSRRGEAIRCVGPPKGVGSKIRKLLLRKEMAPRNPPHNRVVYFADLRRHSFSRFQAQVQEDVWYISTRSSDLCGRDPRLSVETNDDAPGAPSLPAAEVEPSCSYREKTSHVLPPRDAPCLWDRRGRSDIPTTAWDFGVSDTQHLVEGRCGSGKSPGEKSAR